MMSESDMTRFRILFLLLGLTSCIPARGEDAADPPLRWWKGNIHTHTLWSDGNDFPEMIADWYRSRGYHFLALSDHNLLSEGMRWMKHDAIVRRGGAEALAKYQHRFGKHWVETRGNPDSDDFEVRLKPLNEFRALLEQSGKFILIQSEEISDRAEGKPVHMNAANLKEAIQPLGGKTVREAIENNFRAVQDQADRTGREILLHLNHPNFGWAITAEDIARVVSERFFEVYNGHPGVNHQGDHQHPSVERLWDIANTIRLRDLQAAPLMGVATDDSHNYHGRPGSQPGRGWIVVRSRYLTPQYLIQAIKAGDFYASSGVSLERIAWHEEKQELEITIAGEKGVTYRTEFIGTLAEDHHDDDPDKAELHHHVGEVFSAVDGLNPKYRLAGNELYVRAVVTASRPHPNPSFKGQFEQAWTQPVGWKLAGNDDAAESAAAE